MKARHLTKAQGPKVLLHAQNPAHYAHYAHLKLKYRHQSLTPRTKGVMCPHTRQETMLVRLKCKDKTQHKKHCTLYIQLKHRASMHTTLQNAHYNRIHSTPYSCRCSLLYSRFAVTAHKIKVSQFY